MTRRGRIKPGRGSGTIFPRRRPDVVLRRSVFAALLVAALMLLTIGYRGGAVLHGPQLALQEALSPIERGAASAWSPIAGAWNWIGRVVHATGENPKLKRENEQLRLQLAVNQARADRQEKLERMLGFSERGHWPSGAFALTPASIVSRPTGVGQTTLTIDRGASDGMAVNDPVMSDSGMAGRITNVTAHTATVDLILDDTQQIAVQVGTGARGILRAVASEGAPVLAVDYVDQAAPVHVGDLVSTSGFRDGELSSLFPGGIPIGQVTDVHRDPADTTVNIQVSPSTDFSSLTDVFVVVPRSRGAAS